MCGYNLIYQMTQELLATHQILSLFEQSKSLADQIFDNLAGVFANIQRDGKILRANKELAQFLKAKHEDALGSNISQIFNSSLWRTFEEQLNAVTDGRLKSAEFELPLEVNGEIRDYLWQINPMYGEVFTCIGRDVSAVKKALSMAKDFEVTKAVQQLLLPDSYQIGNEHVEVAASYISASVTGGDFLWYDFVTKDKLWIMVGDLTGHGPGPAMVAAMVSGCVQTLREVGQAGKISIELPMIMEAIGQRLLQLRDQPYWMTMGAVEICWQSNTLKLFGAASPPLCLIGTDGRVQYIEASSSPLGNGPPTIRETQVSFVKGQRAVVMTDGIFEARNASQSELGLRRLKKILEKSRGLPIAAARDDLLAAVEAWREGLPPDDDVTVAFVDRK